jgi:hypothetical protein
MLVRVEDAAVLFVTDDTRHWKPNDSLCNSSMEGFTLILPSRTSTRLHLGCRLAVARLACSWTPCSVEQIIPTVSTQQDYAQDGKPQSPSIIATPWYAQQHESLICAQLLTFPTRGSNN